MLFLHKLGRLINTLSIDVALGAWACSRLYYIDSEQIPNLYVDLSLILAVWLIYTADHLYDAKRVTFHELSFRHKFHKTHFKSILVIWILLSILLTWLVIFMLPLKTILFGMVLAILVGVHFLINHILKIKVFVGKEARIAMFYALGTSIPLISLTNTYSIQLFIILTHIGLLAIENLLLFSMADYVNDRLDYLPSISKKWQPEKLKSFIRYTLLFHLGLLICTNFIIQNTSLWLIMIGMYLIMGAVFLTFERHDKMDRYRVLADGLFLLPLILFLFQ